MKKGKVVSTNNKKKSALKKKNMQSNIGLP